MDAYTISKIQIYRHDPKKWKKVLLENIGADILPKFYGGNLTDPDGNPKLTTLVSNKSKKVHNAIHNQKYTPRAIETSSTNNFVKIVSKAFERSKKLFGKLRQNWVLSVIFAGATRRQNTKNLLYEKYPKR